MVLPILRLRPLKYIVILAVLLSGLATSASKLGYRLGMDWASTHFALYDVWVDDTLWTGPRWRLFFSSNLPGLEFALPAACTWTCSAHCLYSKLLCLLPGLELALPAAWTRTCSARCLDSKFLCTLPGLELVLPAAASSDHRIFCLAVLCGPAFRFPTGVVWLLHCSYCFDVTTLLYIPHTHLTPVLYLQVGNWQCVPTWTGTEEYCRAEAAGVVIGVIVVQPLRRNNRIYCADTLDVLTGLACSTSGLRVQVQPACLDWECRVRLGKEVVKIEHTQ